MRVADVSVWRNRALLMGQVTTVLCGLAAVWLLAEVLLDADRPASVRVAFRPVTNWPEIKRGGPELSTPSSADELAGSSPSPLEASLERGTTTDNTVQAPAGLPVRRRPYELTSTGGAEAMQGLTAPVSSLDLKAQPSVRLVASDGPSEANAPAEPDDVRSAAPVVTSGVAAPSLAPTGAGSKASTRPRERVPTRDPQRGETNDQQVQSRARHSFSTVLPSREGSKVEPRSQKRPSAQPTRIAAAQQQELSATPTARGTEEAVPDKDRMRLLGIPVPTGSELKQCLFEFRC
jgi:hypothetical protein